MLQISRDNVFQIYQDYLNYRYSVVKIEDLTLKPSEVVIRTQTFRSQDAMLDKWMYQEEVAGRLMVSQDGLTIGITEAGRKVYEAVSPYFQREYTGV